MSTKTSIEYIDIKTAYIHVYTECFDTTDRVYIETWEQVDGHVECETISVPAEVWDKLREAMRAK